MAKNGGYPPELVIDITEAWMVVLDHFCAVMPEMFLGWREAESREKLYGLFEEAVASYPRRGTKTHFLRNVTSYIEEHFLEEEVGGEESVYQEDSYLEHAFLARDSIEAEYLC